MHLNQNPSKTRSGFCDAIQNNPLSSTQEKTEEIASKQEAVDSTVESGLELMKHISGDEALQLKDKLDALQRRYNDLTSRGAELLRVASETLPLVQQLYNSHARLVKPIRIKS